LPCDYAPEESEALGSTTYPNLEKIITDNGKCIKFACNTAISQKLICYHQKYIKLPKGK
jgi:hypothetical protein